MEVVDKEDEGVSEEEYEPHELTAPDGGLRAWLVALGVRLPGTLLLTPLADQLVLFAQVGCGIGSTFGFVNAWGVSIRQHDVYTTPTHESARAKVFQAYYETTVLPTTSPSTIAWIGSVQVSILRLTSAPGL